MRVAFDMTPVISGNTGVARYVRELANALAARGVEIRPFALGRGVRPPPPGTRWTRVPLRVLQRSWRLASIPSLDRLAPEADLVHTDLAVPPTRRPVVVTVYDVDAVEHPELHPARNVRMQEGMLRSLGRARGIVAISETTREALGRHGVDPARVVVSPCGVTALPPAEPARLGDGREYVLHVGSVNRRKGLDVLLHAMASSAIPDDVALVLAGPDENAASDLRALSDRLGLRARVRWEGRVDDGRLSALYGGASVACCPSRAEGFGLPLLEAMAAGVPVVGSDIPAFREVSGGAAVLVPPEDPAALAAALASTMTTPDQGRIEAGRRQAARYTWETAADRAIDAYEAALSYAG
jgi:glycosyltransferase involved in cell wall biosynthesis